MHREPGACWAPAACRATLRALLATALLLSACQQAAAVVPQPGDTQPLLSAVPAPGQRCSPQVPLPPGLNLTSEEQELLPYICWPPEGVAPGLEQAQRLRNGVPPGVNCTVVQWCVASDCALWGSSAACAVGMAREGRVLRLQAKQSNPQAGACTALDWLERSSPSARVAPSTPPLQPARPAPRCADDVCSEVCQRGSVVVEPWLDHAVRQQARLVQSLPLCWATLLGTHNSAISLADGYGNLDAYFQGGMLLLGTAGCRWVLLDAVLSTHMCHALPPLPPPLPLLQRSALASHAGPPTNPTPRPHRPPARPQASSNT